MFKHIYHDFLHTNTNRSLIVIIYRIFSIMLPVAKLMGQELCSRVSLHITSYALINMILNTSRRARWYSIRNKLHMAKSTPKHYSLLFLMLHPLSVCKQRLQGVPPLENVAVVCHTKNTSMALQAAPSKSCTS